QSTAGDVSYPGSSPAPIGPSSPVRVRPCGLDRVRWAKPQVYRKLHSGCFRECGIQPCSTYSGYSKIFLQDSREVSSGKALRYSVRISSKLSSISLNSSRVCSTRSRAKSRSRLRKATPVPPAVDTVAESTRDKVNQ